ncbi:MAG: hypothetical protein AAB638_00980 [Patescibacteria group bacterium]
MLLKGVITISVPYVAENLRPWEEFAKSVGCEARLIRTIDIAGTSRDDLAIVKEPPTREVSAFEDFLSLTRRVADRFTGAQSSLKFLFPCHLHRAVLYSEARISFLLKPHHAVEIEGVCKKNGVLAQRDLPLRAKMPSGMERWTFIGQSLEGENTFEKETRITLAYTDLASSAVGIFRGGSIPDKTVYRIIKDSAYE